MNNLRKKISNATLIAGFIFTTLFFTGCGDSEMAKGIADVVKKSIGVEVAKKGEGIKKQFDQIINLGAGKGQKEDGKGTAGMGKEKSEKGSGEESEEEKD
jgi:hypothetical protein